MNDVNSPLFSVLADAAMQQRGLRATPARVAVLATLYAAPAALTHLDISAATEVDGEALDRVTLYRVLDWLVAQGLAHKIAGDDRVWRFNANANMGAQLGVAVDSSASTQNPVPGQMAKHGSGVQASNQDQAHGHNHAHFHCNTCGRMYCLDTLQPVFALTLPPGFAYTQIELTLRGRCPSCSQAH